MLISGCGFIFVNLVLFNKSRQLILTGIYRFIFINLPIYLISFNIRYLSVFSVQILKPFQAMSKSDYVMISSVSCLAWALLYH